MKKHAFHEYLLSKNRVKILRLSVYSTLDQTFAMISLICESLISFMRAFVGSKIKI